MPWPFSFAWTIPEIYSVSAISGEVQFDGIDHRYNHILERVNFGFKNFASSRYGISDDSNIMNIVVFHGGNKTDANSH